MKIYHIAWIDIQVKNNEDISGDFKIPIADTYGTIHTKYDFQGKRVVRIGQTIYRNDKSDADFIDIPEQVIISKKVVGEVEL